MTDPILGLHHVTATTDDAQEDLDCYTDLLGLRLVKKTINFDNPSVFHFYYGNETGTPGTLMTTFPYRGWGVPRGSLGAGQVTTTTFSVPADALPAWAARLEEADGTSVARTRSFGAEALEIDDPSGLRLAVVGAEADDREPWRGGDVPGEMAIRGVESVTLSVHRPEPTIRFLVDVLGWRVDEEEECEQRGK